MVLIKAHLFSLHVDDYQKQNTYIWITLVVKIKLFIIIETTVYCLIYFYFIFVVVSLSQSLTSTKILLSNMKGLLKTLTQLIYRIIW